MVPRISQPANSDLSWPALTGKHEFRYGGRNGIGLHVASWIAEELGYVVVAMVPIAQADGRKMPFEEWGDGKPAGKYRTPMELRREYKNKHGNMWNPFRFKCGVGILAGKSGLVCIDIDNEAAWEELCAGREMPRTMSVQTHKGRHLIFRDETGISKTQGGQLAPGVDVRGNGGLFVVYDPGQPERHFTDIASPADLPGWLREAIPRAGTRGSKKASGPKPADIKRIAAETIPPGQHHDWLISRALGLVNKGWTKKDREEWFMLASGVLARSGEGTDAKGNARPPFTEEEIYDCFDTALEKAAQEVADGEPENEFEDPAFDNFFSADTVDPKKIEWLNEPFLPLGFLVIIDGDPGQGKSAITTGMVARAASGLPVLPFGHPGRAADEEIHCGMIGAEDDIAGAVVPRLMAAGYVRNEHIWFMGLSKDVKGNIQMLTFPKGTARVRRFIEQYKLQLVIVDPISAFIGEDIQTHNEASVRRALQPLAEVARETGCCIVLVRHLNKDGAMKAMYRGTGSIAFSAIARSGIITGVCPDTGEFAIAQVKVSYSELFQGVIRYSLARSDSDSSTVVVQWGDIDTELTADDIAIGRKNKPGPAASVQEEIRIVLKPMFDERDTWSQQECTDALSDAGIEASPTTVKKALVSLGIRPCQVFRADGKIDKWVWTTKKVTIIRMHNA